MSDCYPGMEWKVEGVVVPRTERERENVVETVETVTVGVDEGLRKGKGKSNSEGFIKG